MERIGQKVVEILEKISKISGIEFHLFEKYKKTNPVCQRCGKSCSLVKTILDYHGEFEFILIECRVVKGNKYVIGVLKKLGNNFFIVSEKKKRISLKKYREAYELLKLLWQEKFSSHFPILKRLDSDKISLNLKKRIERVVKELEIFYKVSNALESVIKLKELFEVTIDLIPEVMNVENCSLMVLDRVTGKLKIAAARGLPQEVIESVEVELGEGISGAVAKSGEPILIDDIRKTHYYNSRYSHGNSSYRTVSVLSVPIKRYTEIKGVINVTNKLNGEKFLQEDLELLQALSNQIAHYIEKAELLEKTRRQLEMLSSINEIGRAISSSLDTTTVMERILNEVVRLLDADKGSIMILEDGKLKIKAAFGLDDIDKDNFYLLPGEGIAGRVLESGSPMLIMNTSKSQFYKKTQESEQSESMICVPLVSKKRVFGIISIERYLQNKGAFGYDELEWTISIAAQASISLENANLYQNLLSTYLETIQSLANAIEAKDKYTHGHSQRVAQYTAWITEEMGMDEKEREMLHHTALLHDIGKIGISESILLKPGGLTDEEFEVIRSHPLLGTNIVKSIDFLSRVRDQVKYHHERYDGKGYPDGLKGEEIPLGARIICVADTFDAMTSDRPYRKALPLSVAVKELMKNAGTQFDPKIVKYFIRALKKREKFPEEIKVEVEEWLEN